MKYSITVLSLLICLIGCRKRPAATQSATPATADAPTNIWLDRADRDIAALPTDPPEDLYFLNPADLAIELYIAVPTDARRAAAAKLIDLQAQKFIERDTTRPNDPGTAIACAMSHARIGDFDAARRWLAKAAATRTASTQPSDLDPIGMADIFDAQVDLLLGDDPAFEKVRLKPFGEYLLGEDLRADGRIDLAKKAAAMQQKKAWAEQPTEFGFPGFSRVDVVKSLVKNGDTAAAAKLAATLETDLPKADGSLGSIGRYQFSAELEIAKETHRTGDGAAYRTAVNAAIELLKPHLDRVSEFEVDNLLTLLGTAKDTEGIDRLAAIEADLIRKQETGDASDKIRVARDLAACALAYAKSGATAKYRDFVGRAETIVKSVKTVELPSWQAASLIEEWAMDCLYISVAEARAGDTAGVIRNAALSQQISGGTKTKFWDEPWSEVVINFADTGQFDHAVDAMAQGRDAKDLGSDAIVRARGRAGLFDDAWDLAIKAGTTRGRYFLEYFLVVAQVRAGHTDGLPERIDAAKTPQEKALMDVAAARAVAGKPFIGSFRVFETREE